MPTCLRTTCIQCLQRPEEGAGSPGNKVTKSCELLYGCWELNSGSVKEQPVLLTTESIQPIITSLDRILIMCDFKNSCLKGCENGSVDKVLVVQV